MGTRCGHFGVGIPAQIDRGNDAASGISTRLWCCKWCVKGVVSDSNCEFAAISLIGSTAGQHQLQHAGKCLERCND